MEDAHMNDMALTERKLDVTDAKFSARDVDVLLRRHPRDQIG